MSHEVVLGLVRGLSMLVFFTAAAALVAAASTETPRIIVEGWGSVEMPADVANISYDVRGEGATNDQALADLVKKSAAVEKALRSIDPAIDLTSNTVSVQRVRGSACREDQYEGTVRLSSGECAVKGFVAAQDFNLKTARVADAGTIVGLAGRHGAFNPRIGGFDLSDDRDAKRRAIAAAMEEARGKAEAVAAGSSAQLGAILAVSLDNARDSSDSIPLARRGLPPAAERDEPIEVSIAPKPVETHARVSVTYAIAGASR